MGPLAGVKVVEIGGIGPVPYCGMLLSDMGAEIVRIERSTAGSAPGGIDAKYNISTRNRQSIVIDFKRPEGIEAALALIAGADILLEGFRPGVMERLGLGPETCAAINPRLVFGRMTGWGQDGPLSATAGHDLNYIALSGALHAIGPRDGPPVPPLILVGDLGAGGMMLALGVMGALWEARGSGQGQVVDASIADGAASLMAFAYGLLAGGDWIDERGSNAIDGGSPYYAVYEAADGKFVSFAAMEPQFYQAFLDHAGVAGDPDLPDRRHTEQWPALRAYLARLFKQRTRDEWSALLEGTDSCVAPVLTIAEAPHHAHAVARDTFLEIAGVPQPRPMPRFSRSVHEVNASPAQPGRDTDQVLTSIGYDAERIAHLRAICAVA